ncbi:MAG: extracellular solute-binding protein [Methylocystis sp.]|nr:extracellular solute-binding protein [Methylocystis sp.]MCA3588868.1 extracellular solute-binding protein [Methylocystis sp.]MCA3592949.1 extracellular solute-binding protein [Methylocystis sp.]
MRINRRHFVAATISVVAMPHIARSQARELVMIGYGTAQDDPIKRVAAELGKRHAGVTLRVIGGLSAEALAQIKAARGASPYDLAVMGTPAIINAVGEDVLEPLTVSKIPSFAKLDPRFPPAARGVGVPVNFSGFGIAYNKQTVRTPPTTWADLWKPEFAGKVGLARPQSNLGLGAVSIASRAFGRPDDDMEFGLQKWRELKPLVGRSPPLLQQMLERGEIGACILWHDNTALAAATGLPFGYVKTPQPIILPSSVVMFRRTAHAELIHEFAEIFLSEEIQRFQTNPPYFFGPTLAGVPTPQAAAEFLPSTPAEVAAMASIDWEKVAPQRGKTVEAFDRMFAG